MEKTTSSDKQTKNTSMAGKAGRKMSKLFQKLKLPKRSKQTTKSEETAPSVTSTAEQEPVVLQVSSQKLSQFLQKEESATLVMSERVEDPVCLQVDPDKLKRILAQ